ncbi:low affinity iron permease family protein [Plasticicumulans sp.]|uniref:low affinity iron permease family protein n=1 Tax=Plasticicumulans sp. TaxID=2307179 RepID=UPI002CC339D2|nr:low affinity iron permease family protein [Plasticicumulans sp.]HNF64817.1 low affinity iron permease family protein [Plasticicumulans sp.]HNM42488.1 low affinity iron permease family protein [Plasticicumulans sp.]
MQSRRNASLFVRFASATARCSGRPVTFVLAFLVIVVWGVTGPLFHYSDTWQLVINTGTTIVTFLMVFLIQNTQNRDAEAVQVKLDELIRATRGAHNALLNLEELEDRDIERIRVRYQRLAEEARAALRSDGGGDTDTPEAGEDGAAADGGRRQD